MTPPRYNEAGQICFVTVQAVSRTMRFLPTGAVCDSIDYLLAMLVAKYGIAVHEYLFMSNHFHLVATDPKGKISKFLQEFDSMLSRQLNALRGATGRNFEAEPSWPRIVDAATIVDKAVYTLVNPCAAHLVKRLQHWKGCSSLGLEYGETVTIDRPDCGIWKHTRDTKNKQQAKQGKYPSTTRLRYRGRSKAPESVDFTLARPDAMQQLSDAELRSHIRDCAGVRERKLIDERRKSGQKVLGWRNVILQHYLEIPQSFRVLFQRQPRVIGQDGERRGSMLRTILRFERKYRIALAKFIQDKETEFPFGTLRMADCYCVCCATAPP